MPPREVTLSKAPTNSTPLVIKKDSEENQKKSLETFKKNPEADAYVKKLIEKGCCPIVTNVVALEVTKSKMATQELIVNKTKNNLEKTEVGSEKPDIKKEISVLNKNENKNQHNSSLEKTTFKTSVSHISVFNSNPPKKEVAQNNVSLEKTEIVSFSKNVNTKNTEVKTQAQPVTVTRYPTNAQETKAPVNSQVVIQNTASTQAKPEVINQNIQITTQVATPNPVVQINLIPQVMPALNTVLLTQLIPQKGIGNFSGIKNFADFLPIKNNKQNLVESEKFQFSTPLISTKVLAQILNNKDTTSLNALRALLHLFGREIEDEKDDTDLEGAYGLWKEYLKKIKRKKSKQALSQNRQQKTQSFDMEELGIRS